MPVSRAASGSGQHVGHPGRDGAGLVAAASRWRCCGRCTRTNKNSSRASNWPKQACHIEIDLLGEPIGKQDQYIASLRRHHRLRVPPGWARGRASRCRSAPRRCTTWRTTCCCSSPASRAPPPRFWPSRTSARGGDSGMIDHLHRIKQFGYESKAALEAGDLRRFAAIMHEHWERKKQRSQSMTNSRHRRILRAGAGQRRAGRQADRRRRRRLPDVVHRGQDAPAARHARSRAARSAHALRFRRHVAGGAFLTHAARCHPGRRSGHALAAGHRHHSQGADRNQRRAVPGAPVAVVAAQRCGTRGALRGLSAANRCGTFAGDGRAFGLHVEYSFGWAAVAGHRRAPFAARCRCWATSFFVLYGDSYLPCDYAPRWNGVSALRASRA